jgi:hypothetical protein
VATVPPSLAPRPKSLCAARATTLRDKVDAEAKERQKAGQEKGRGKQSGRLPENLPETTTKADARDQLGKTFGMSGRTVDYGMRVLNRGIPLLLLWRQCSLAWRWFVSRAFSFMHLHKPPADCCLIHAQQFGDPLLGVVLHRTAPPRRR